MYRRKFIKWQILEPSCGRGGQKVFQNRYIDVHSRGCMYRADVKKVNTDNLEWLQQMQLGSNHFVFIVAPICGKFLNLFSVLLMFKQVRRVSMDDPPKYNQNEKRHGQEGNYNFKVFLGTLVSLACSKPLHQPILEQKINCR